MAISQIQKQSQKQTQKQVQKLSQKQIQAVNMIAMSSKNLTQEIYKQADENPALKIEKNSFVHKRELSSSSVDVQSVLEAREDRGETLQQHLMSQLNMSKVSSDEYELCQKLIYNLDKNGCYGSMLDPFSFIDKSKPKQTKELVLKCIERIQRMDPVGTCCKNVTESLLVQAKINGDASELTLFLLEENHLEFLNPPVPEKILNRLNKFREDWHSKSFASEIILDKINLSKEIIEDSLAYIRNLNPYPAGDYISDTSKADFTGPDVVLTVEKKKGYLPVDDFSKGLVKGDDDNYFQVKYASGVLPEVSLDKNFTGDKNLLEKAKSFIENLLYRENTIILQGCVIVSKQKEFFLSGKENFVPLTRRTVAQILQIHESTVSRMANKKDSKYLQCEWGIFPVSYFFSSSLNTADNNKISSVVVKNKIASLLKEKPGYSDNELCQLLNVEGIKIARRTVAKYRNQIGIQNSYYR